MFQAEMSDRLIADELQTHSARATIGRQIIVLEQTSSTNDAILQVATANSNQGLVLFAEHQTAGRGQRGNRWESAAGKGLWFSILLRPKIQINDSGCHSNRVFSRTRDQVAQRRSAFRAQSSRRAGGDARAREGAAPGCRGN